MKAWNPYLILLTKASHKSSLEARGGEHGSTSSVRGISQPCGKGQGDSLRRAEAILAINNSNT